MRVLRIPATITAIVMSAQILGAQTKITPPKNKYSPQDDVKLGREASAQVEQQLPLLRDDNVTSFVSDIGQRLVAAIPAELQHPEFQLHLQGRQREGNQRVRAAGRADVRQPRHDRSRAHRRRGRRRDRARVEPRGAPSRHRAGDQSDQVRDRHDCRRRARRDHRRHRRAASSPRARSSGLAPRSCDSAASSRSRRTSRGRRSWRGRATTRATWRTCSRRSRSRAGPAARSG